MHQQLQGAAGSHRRHLNLLRLSAGLTSPPRGGSAKPALQNVGASCSSRSSQADCLEGTIADAIGHNVLAAMSDLRWNESACRTSQRCSFQCAKALLRVVATLDLEGTVADPIRRHVPAAVADLRWNESERRSQCSTCPHSKALCECFAVQLEGTIADPIRRNVPAAISHLGWCQVQRILELSTSDRGTSPRLNVLPSIVARLLLHAQLRMSWHHERPRKGAADTAGSRRPLKLELEP
mmetsp:Transcript_14390/g.39267  ORF Transcript_14390/g.39267 Transcript_14390/m.39267 type:complete len:238 (+) Transcript_14390:1078-1791(+)